MLLSIFCNSIMMHGFIRSVMLDTTLTPIVKVKTGDVTDKNNYRPIAVATSMSKVMELLVPVLSNTECFLNTSDNQFGFKKNHGTDMCIHAFRQTCITTIRSVCKCVLTNMSFSSLAAAIPLQS